MKKLFPDEAELVEADARALFEADYANYPQRNGSAPTWESAADWVRDMYREIVCNPYAAGPR